MCVKCTLCMKILRRYQDDKIVYDNTKSNTSEIILNLEEGQLLIDFEKIIDTQFTAGNVKEKFELLKNLLNLGMYSKAPCGGLVNFYQVKNGDRCFIVYSGVNEVSNSHYTVTIHKILSE